MSSTRIHCCYTIPAATAAKSLQSCPTLCVLIDGSPPGSPVPGILQARTLEWVVSFFSNVWNRTVKMKSLSLIWLLATPWTAAYQGSSTHGIFQARVLEWVAIAFSIQFLVQSLNLVFFCCCLILISGLKEKVMCLRHIKTLKSHFMCLRPRDVEGKKVFVLSSSLRIPDPYLLFKSPRSPFSSSGIPDFLSTCLWIDSHRRRQSTSRKKKVASIMNYPEAFLSKLIHTHFP